MEVKNGKAVWTPEDMLGSWIKCTNEQAEKLMKYFKIPVPSAAEGEAFYNICATRTSYTVAPLSDNKILTDGYFNFASIEFPVPLEIIGYKCPCYLFEKKVKPGTVYVKFNKIDLYGPADKFIQTGYFTLPKEIVEDWEPVYEPVMKYAINTALLTKDGRVCGNAIITGYEGQYYLITTDYGNKIKFSEKEVESQWHIGSTKNANNHKHAVK